MKWYEDLYVGDSIEGKGNRMAVDHCKNVKQMTNILQWSVE